jgi:hypothetical protein
MKTATLLATISAASDRTSGDLDLGDFIGFSMTVLISGSDIVGSLKLQASNDGTTYVDISGSTQAITASADHIYSISDAQYRYVRCVWTATSGTGNITITGYVKEPYKVST